VYGQKSNNFLAVLKELLEFYDKFGFQEKATVIANEFIPLARQLYGDKMLELPLIAKYNTKKKA